MTLLHNVKLCGLDCVLPVVQAHNQLLVALGRLGVGKGELRRCLGNRVPNAAVRVLVAELNQVLRGHSRSHRSRTPQVQNHRCRCQRLSDERLVLFGGHERKLQGVRVSKVVAVVVLL